MRNVNINNVSTVIFESYDEAMTTLSNLRLLTRRYCTISCIDHVSKDILTIKEHRKFCVVPCNKSLERCIQGEFFKVDKEIQHIISYYFRVGNMATLRDILSFIFPWYPKTLDWCNKKFKKMQEIC